MDESTALKFVECLEEDEVIFLENPQDVNQVELLALLSGIETCHCKGSIGTPYDGLFIISRIPRLVSVGVDKG
jgi:hypothetical protein